MSPRSSTMFKMTGMWLWVVLCAVVCTIGATQAQAIATPELRLEIKESPKPIVVGETAMAKFSGYFVDKTTGQEIYPSGVSISWSCPWTQLAGGTQNNNTSNIGFNPSSTAANDVTTMSATFGTVGEYSVRVRATASSNGWTPETTITAATTVTVSVKDVIVTLNVGKTKTGYWANTSSPDYKDIFQTGNATIRPASALGGLSLGLKTGTGYDNNVTIAEKSRAAGKITFEWRGTSGSTVAKVVNGANVPAGITQIEARYNGVAKDQKIVIVVVPQTVKKQPTVIYPTGPVSGKNEARNTDSTPPESLTRDPWFALVTAYYVNTTVTVLDQFGSELGDLYTGADVIEDTPDATGVNINQKLSGSSYTDPVGPKPSAGDPIAANVTYPGGEETKNDWVNGATLSPMFETNSTTAVSVYIAGHKLSSDLNRRIISVRGATPTQNTLTITWED